MSIILVSEQYPREDRSKLEVNTNDPEVMASSVNLTWPFPSEEKLDEVFEHFGGIEAFSAKSMSAGMKSLRNALMRSGNFSSQKYREIFDKTLKIDRNSVIVFTSQDYFLTDLNKFMRIWNTSSVDAIDAVKDFKFSGNHNDYYGTAEVLPTVHSADCSNTDPNDTWAHYYCAKPVLYHTDRKLAFCLKKKEELEAYAGSGVIDFIHKNILDSPIKARAHYASSLIVREDHWEQLAKDSKREVLNAVAENPLLPTHVAEEIVSSHKTPSLRIDIARNSVDQDLLNKIWNGTKSAEIREAVESNRLFIRL
jgi:hypothetical protein